MSATLTVADLPPGEPINHFVVVDPGRRCGLALVRAHRAWEVSDCTLDELPAYLEGYAMAHGLAFIACEDFSLTGGNRRNDPKVPAAVGIGIVRGICWHRGLSCVLIQRGAKRAGHQALDTDAEAAFKAARNDHQRDVVDLAGYVLREVRTRAHNSKPRA